MLLRFEFDNTNSRYMAMCEELSGRRLLSAMRTGVDRGQVRTGDMLSDRVCRRMSDTMRLMEYDGGTMEPGVSIRICRGVTEVRFVI